MLTASRNARSDPPGRRSTESIPSEFQYEARSGSSLTASSRSALARVRSPWSRNASPKRTNERVLRQQRERFLIGGDRGRQAAPPAPRRPRVRELRVFGRGCLPAVKRSERGIEVAHRDLRVGEREVGGAGRRQPLDRACEMVAASRCRSSPASARPVIVNFEAVDAAADQAIQALHAHGEPALAKP